MNGRFNPIRPSSTRHITAAAVIGFEHDAIGKIESRSQRPRRVLRGDARQKLRAARSMPRRATSTARLGVSPVLHPAADELRNRCIRVPGSMPTFSGAPSCRPGLSFASSFTRRAWPRWAATGTGRAPKLSFNVSATAISRSTRRRRSAAACCRRARPTRPHVRRAAATRATSSQAAHDTRGPRLTASRASAKRPRASSARILSLLVNPIRP